MTGPSPKEEEEPAVQSQVVNGGYTRPVPGNIACADGHIWVGGTSMVATGKVLVSRAQALFALRYGWQAVQGDKREDGLVLIQRDWNPTMALRYYTGESR